LVASSSFEDSVLTQEPVAVGTVTGRPAVTVIDRFWKGTSTRESSVRPSISTTPNSSTTEVETVHEIVTELVMNPDFSEGAFDLTKQVPLPTVNDLSA
jgi:hypothetical protein